MQKILLFGAGKSATCLIQYLVRATATRNWQLVVADSNLSLAQSKIGDAPHARAAVLRVEDQTERDTLIRDADIVISLLPPALHFFVAGSCISWKKNLLTASYLDDKIKALEPAIKENNLLFICEMGLDPGIDHMSAMELIHRISAQGGRIRSFRSHTGGLVSPQSDDNPWRYKISWNPRNVVLAGSAGATWLKDGQTVTRQYTDLFDNCEEVPVEGIGSLAWYPNRDSLSYIPVYGLEGTGTFIRTTLRYPEYCRAWSSIVRAGLTNDQIPLPMAPSDSPSPLSFAAWSAPILPFVDGSNREPLNFLGLFSTDPIPTTAQTSADVLQYLLETRLAMRPEDKDMIVMLHEITYDIPSGSSTDAAGTQLPPSVTRQEILSRLIVHGEDSLRTAMAKTVGLPLGIAAILLLEGKIGLRGLHIPILPEIYQPVLKELATEGIRFEETIRQLD